MRTFTDTLEAMNPNAMWLISSESATGVAENSLLFAASELRPRRGAKLYGMLAGMAWAPMIGARALGGGRGHPSSCRGVGWQAKNKM